MGKSKKISRFIIPMKLILVFVILLGCLSKDSKNIIYTESSLKVDYGNSGFARFLNGYFNLNNDYEEYYRFYYFSRGRGDEFLGVRRNYVLTVFKENNIWYLSYDWYMIIHEGGTPEQARELEFKRTLYVLDNEDINNLGNIKNEYKKIEYHSIENTAILESRSYIDFNNTIREFDHGLPEDKKIERFFDNLLGKHHYNEK